MYYITQLFKKAQLFCAEGMVSALGIPTTPPLSLMLLFLSCSTQVDNFPTFFLWYDHLALQNFHWIFCVFWNDCILLRAVFPRGCKYQLHTIQLGLQTATVLISLSFPIQRSAGFWRQMAGCSCPILWDKCSLIHLLDIGISFVGR